MTRANFVKSKLFSPSDIQCIMKKAMVERMKQIYKKEWFPEDGAPFLIYNGMLKTYFYQFMGLRPPKKKPEQ